MIRWFGSRFNLFDIAQRDIYSNELFVVDTNIEGLQPSFWGSRFGV